MFSFRLTSALVGANGVSEIGHIVTDGDDFPSIRVRGQASEPPNAHMTDNSRSVAVTYENRASFNGGE